MVEFEELVEQPKALSRVLFWLGGVFAGLALIFYASQMDRMDDIYQIQAPFGLLFLIAISLVIIVGIFTLTSIYGVISAREPAGHFTPVAKVTLLFLVLLIIMGIELIAMVVYQTITVLSTG
ncbi:MAG: hypothetical protein ACFFAJ_07355 [Candidatus Hodarchaeota archaeon]